MENYDLVIIGAGPGGMAALNRASIRQMKTLVVERDQVGGTCLNRGCIPTKTLLTCAERYDEARNGASFGVPEITAPFLFEKGAMHRDTTVKRLRAGVEFLIKRSRADFLRGEASFIDPQTLSINGNPVTFKRLIIAAGSAPNPDAFRVEPGASFVNTDGFLALQEMPENVTILGGGVTGLEFATILVKIGCAVTLIKRSERFLPDWDEELGQLVYRTLKKKGVTFYIGTKTDRVFRSSSGKTVIELEKDGVSFTVETDLAIDTTQRKPCTDSLLPKRVGLKLDFHSIAVDDYCRTNLPGIYAIGDINGRIKLAHAAAYQGEKVVENFFGLVPEPILSAPVPSAIHTDPEIASAGMTFAQAQAFGYQVKLGRAEAVANGRLLGYGTRNGFVKLVADTINGKILGAQLAVPRATEMIAEISTVLKMGVTARQLADTIHPHPTVSEMICEAAKQI